MSSRSRPSAVPTGAAALLLLAAACGGKPAPAPLTTAEADLVAEAEALQAAVCACPDRACDDGYRERVGKLLVEPPQGLALSDSGALRWGRAVFALVQCTAARSAGESDAVIAELTGLRDDACGCKDDACAHEVSEGFDAFIGRYRDFNAPEDVAERAGAIAEEMIQCLGRFEPADDHASLASAGPTGMPACDAYMEAIDAYQTCEKVPQAARDAAREGAQAMRDAWADVGDLPDDVRTRYDEACASAVVPLRKGASSLGCTI